jgi:hypothetical protein
MRGGLEERWHHLFTERGLQKVMALKGWTGGLSNMFLFFASRGGVLFLRDCVYMSYPEFPF